MALSLSHTFGQMIGDLLELAFEPHLQDFATKHGLYLDKKGARKTRTGKKLSWFDSNKNSHDLDFVLERDGTDDKLGTPIAFVETAWRRYTKHSKNKAGEIARAILPLAERYKNSHPFLGVVLAGKFTKTAITQLQSDGFCVLYFEYEDVMETFDMFGFDCRWDESTPEKKIAKKIRAFRKLPHDRISQELLRMKHAAVEEFFNSLTKSVSRLIERIIILPLYGNEKIMGSVVEALDFLHSYEEAPKDYPFTKYEIIIKYNNGDGITASFRQKHDAIKFLKGYAS